MYIGILHKGLVTVDSASLVQHCSALSSTVQPIYVYSVCVCGMIGTLSVTVQQQQAVNRLYARLVYAAPRTEDKGCIHGRDNCYGVRVGAFIATATAMAIVQEARIPSVHPVIGRTPYGEHHTEDTTARRVDERAGNACLSCCLAVLLSCMYTVDKFHVAGQKKDRQTETVIVIGLADSCVQCSAVHYRLECK